MELAYRFSEDIEGYCTGKDAFVNPMIGPDKKKLYPNENIKTVC